MSMCTEKRVWTVAQVRDELPDVVVFVDKRTGTVPGRVCGRKEEFATVCYSMNGRVEVAPFAWETIARCLTENRPLWV